MLDKKRSCEQSNKQTNKQTKDKLFELETILCPKMAKSLDRHFANKTLIHFKLLKCRRQIIRQMSEPGNEKKTDLGKSKSFRKIK